MPESASKGGCLVRGDVSGPRGVCLVPGGCVWSWGCVVQGVSGQGGVWFGEGDVCSGGVWSGECLLQGGSASGGVSASRGVCGIPAYTDADTPLPVDRITDACKNITLAQLRCGR